MDPERTSAQAELLVVGGGPAGLTAALEATKLGARPVVLEKDRIVGGIARTEQHNGYRFDMGGHRFFTKSREVERMWHELLGADFLERPRLSRIHYAGRFFSYPLRPVEALLRLGPFEALRVALSWLRWQVRPHPHEETFEQWVVNRFGYRLFAIFFKPYTEKVWGVSCSELRAEWAAQRIKDLSIRSLLARMVFRPRRVIATLIERFHYPRLGPGMLWEAAASEVVARGGEVRMSTDVVAVEHDGTRVKAVVARRDGDASSDQRLPADQLVTSMPLTELVARLSPPAPPEVREAAASLRYRDFLTVCLVVDGADLFPDNWIYVHDPEVQVGRVQNFGNWSPDMVPEPGRSSLGLEYFCHEGDALWSTPDSDLVALGARELEKLGLARAADVVDGCVFRVPRSYPVYDASYRASLAQVRAFVDGIANLRTIGRNGLHRYNNQDHSMLTGMLAVRSLLRGERHDVWAVNTEGAYLEEVQVEEASSPTIPPQDVAPRPFSWVPKPRASVIIPVRDDEHNLGQCLDAIARSGMSGLEVIVVDDASRDGSAEVAVRAGARLLRLDRGMGPGPARNQGAAAARAPVLIFVDADVRAHPDALRRLVEHIERGEADAAFGSYDDRPAAPGFVSQWKNLSHHWVHQQGREAASTFWSGLGAVRRDTFTASGGYDQSWGVEDIELGVRLRREDKAVLLDKQVQGTHLKHWTLHNVIRTDIFLRGIPWTRLILHERNLPSDLNLAPSQRAAALFALVATTALLAAVVLPPIPMLAASLTATFGVAALNFELLRWFARIRGVWFALRALPMQVLYYHYSVLAFGLGLVGHLWDRRRAASPAAAPRAVGGDAE